MVSTSVHFLADVPQFGEVAMEWIFRQWGSRQGTLEDAKRRAQQYANRDKLPIMFVATVAGEPAGCVVLRATDLEGWEQVGPWLASLYVGPVFRSRGIASRLVAFLETAATDLGYQDLYLFTPDAQGLYFSRGWQQLAEVKHGAGYASVMTKQLGKGVALRG